MRMTLVYARIADRTVADEYFAVTEKVEALYDQPKTLPAGAEGAKMRRLRAEANRRMLGNGYWPAPSSWTAPSSRSARPARTSRPPSSSAPPCNANATTPLPKAKPAASSFSTTSRTIRRPGLVMRQPPTCHPPL